MGRRAIPKIDPSVDLSWHLQQLEDVPQPFHADSSFHAPRPLAIEVGSGKGLFLLNASQDRPGWNFVGIEIARKYARLAAYRLAKSQRRNARVIRGDALKFFRDYLAAGTVREIHVYFPDPWWKERHRRRRIFNPQFVQDVQRVLVPGGELHFWTDVEEYFESALDMVARHSRILAGPRQPEAEQAEHDMDYRTHFERRMRQHEHAVFRCVFTRE